MKQIKTGKLIAAAMLLLGNLSMAQSSKGEVPTQDKPNIIVVLVDDLGYTDINSFDPRNRSYYETPNIDMLAKQGMMFTQAYANAANCAPSRAAIMSGQSYPHQPIYHVGSPGKGAMISAPNATELPLEKITLAEALKGAGYHTGFIGKWHIGDPPEAGPKQQGFNLNIGGYNAGNPSVWEGAYFQPNNNPYITDADDGEYLTDYLTRKAVAYIKKHQTDPFYLQLSYYTPHSPFQAPKPLIQKYKEKERINGHHHATYAAMLESLDRNVGQLMNTLKELDMEENTIVVFFSDNGGVGGYNFLGRSDANITDISPLKGGKTTYYEGGIRVPMIIRWPKKIDAGTTSKEPVIGTDLYPTLLDAAGIEKPKNYVLDGKSLLPLLKNSTAKLEERSLYWHFPGYPNNEWRTGPVSVIRSGPWKLMKFYETDKVELYNLDDDISETHDLADEHPKIRNRLHRQLEHWLDKTDAPLPKHPDGLDSKKKGSAQNNSSDIKQVVYKQIDTLSLSMQVYAPTFADTTQRAPAMVFFFGGGWKNGTVNQFEPHARYFSQRGIVCFLADYRVSSRHHTTPFASLEDAKSAIRYIKEHGPEFQVDTTRIIASGGSAGGQLAAATALTKGFNDPTDNLAYSASPDALVLFNPVVDNGPDGYGYKRVQERYRDFSPLHNIHEGAPPTIIFLGTQDKLIPVETAERYKRKMEEVGSRCDVVLYKDQGHGFFNYKHREFYKETVYEADRFLISLGFLDGKPKIEWKNTSNN